AAKATLSAFRRVGVDPVVYVDHDDLDAFSTTATGTSREHLEMLGPKLGIADMETVVEDHEVLSFGVIGIDYGLGEQIVAETAAVATPRLDRSLDYGGGAL